MTAAGTRRRRRGGSKAAAAATAAVVLSLLACFCGGAVAARVGCTSNADCEARHFCHLPDATCSPPGMCEPMPEICTLEYNPVCGCDDRTYGNRCGAFGAGVSYRFVGECEHPPGTAEEQAQQQAQPLPADASGPTQQKEGGPQRGRRQLGWTDVFAASAEFFSLRRWPAEGDKAAVSGPASASEEGAAGAAAMEGETTRVRCGSRGLPQCDEGYFCEFVDGLCGETDTGGYCSVPSKGCPKLYRPICGCDSVTYSNACVARSQSVSIRHEGDCATQDGSIPTPVESAAAPQQEQHRPEMCGGLMGKGCPAGQHCIYAVEASCGAADQPGVCMEPPVFCAMSFQPVCGCDGNTHSNTCHAHAKGVSVMAEGPCGAPHTPEEAVQQEISKKDQMLASLRVHGPEEVGDAGDNGGL